MLSHLSIDELAQLAADHNIKIDKRWKADRIAALLERSGVEAPTPDLSKLSDRVAMEPVRFVGSIGWIYVRDSKWKTHEGGDREFIPGLKVEFMDVDGEPVGGFSREFYPDRPDHEEALDCSCASCLADLRNYLAHHRYGKVLAQDYHIREARMDEPSMPLPGWDNVNAGDVADLYSKLGFDLANAVRYEKVHGNRPDVLAALDATEAAGVIAPDETLATAEIVV